MHCVLNRSLTNLKLCRTKSTVRLPGAFIGHGRVFKWVGEAHPDATISAKQKWAPSWDKSQTFLGLLGLRRGGTASGRLSALLTTGRGQRWNGKGRNRSISSSSLLYEATQRSSERDACRRWDSGPRELGRELGSSDHRQSEGSRAPFTSETEGSDQLWVVGDYSGGDRLHWLGIDRGKKRNSLFFNIILQRKLGPFNLFLI